MRKFVFLLVFLFAPMSSPSSEAAEAGADTLALEALLAEALAKNPEVAAAREAWRATESRIPAVGALPDPVLEVRLDDQPFEGPGGGETAIMLSQEIPFPGKRRLMTDEAGRMAEAERQRALDTARRVVTEVKVAFWQLYLLESQLATMRESRAALDDAIAASRTRYTAGLAGQQELLLAQVEAGELDGEIWHIEAQAAAARGKLNLLLAREPRAPLGRAWGDSLTPFEMSLESLLEEARTKRPAVLAGEREVAAAETAHRLARVSYRPDFMLSAGYMQMPGQSDEWLAAVGLTLPIWKGRKQDAAAREAARRLEAARHRLDAERNRAGISVEEQFAHVSSERAITRNYRNEIIPQAELAYRSAQAGYLSGRETFLILLESLRKNLELRKAYYEFFADSEMHLALLEEAVGSDLGTYRLDLELGLDPHGSEEGSK